MYILLDQKPSIDNCLTVLMRTTRDVCQTPQSIINDHIVRIRIQVHADCLENSRIDCLLNFFCCGMSWQTSSQKFNVKYELISWILVAIFYWLYQLDNAWWWSGWFIEFYWNGKSRCCSIDSFEKELFRFFWFAQLNQTSGPLKSESLGAKYLILSWKINWKLSSKRFQAFLSKNIL